MNVINSDWGFHNQKRAAFCRFGLFLEKVFISTSFAIYTEIINISIHPESLKYNSPLPKYVPMTNPSDTQRSATDFEKYGYPIADVEKDDVSEDFLRLVCPIDECGATAKFRGLLQVRDSEWTGMSVQDEFLKGGGVIKEAYCPAHYIEETYEPSRDLASHRFGEDKV